MNDIKWLFFDCGSTLVNEDDVFADRMKILSEITGETYEDIYQEMLDFGKKNINGIHEIFKKRNIPKPKWDFSGEKLYEDSEIVLKKLHEKYKIGLIANQLPGTEGRLTKHGIRKYMDVIVASAEEGVSKPDPRIFEIALEKANCQPQNAVMIGDRVDFDIAPAKRIGMKTIRIKQGFCSLFSITNEDERPDYEVDNLSELLEIL